MPDEGAPKPRMCTCNIGSQTRSHPSSPITDQTKQWEIDAFEPPIHKATVFYLQKSLAYEHEKPYFFNIPVEPSWGPKVKQTNVKYTRECVAVADVRGHEDLITLDKQGFAIGNLTSSLSYHDFGETDAIVSKYYDEVKEFLKRQTGAKEVLPFDFQVRRRDPSLPAGSRGAPGKAQPFGAVHGDQTHNAAFRRLKYFHPDHAQKYAKSRFMIVNVWKPLVGPVLDAPLALCDYRTVAKEDCVPCDIIFPDYLGETLNFYPSPKHRYYFIDEQRVDEAWMVKCFDSATAQTPTVAQFAPHVSFSYKKDGGLNAPMRESIEVRTFVFLD